MDNQSIRSLVETVAGRLFVELEASGRHVHVTKDQALALFGHPLTPERPLSQPGQYLAQERLTVIGPKGRFENVAVLGPERGEAQVEVSLTDARTLGLAVPVRLSGDVMGSPGCVLEGALGSVTISQGVIAAQRHIHLTPADAAVFGVRDKQVVKLQTYTARPLIFEDVAVRVRPDFASYVHLDYDEANACGFAGGDLGEDPNVSRALLIGEPPGTELGYEYVREGPYEAVVIGSLSLSGLLRFGDERVLDALAQGKSVYLYTPGLPQAEKNRALAGSLTAAQRELKNWGVLFTDGGRKKLITAEEARLLRLSGRQPGPGAVLTPLAREIMEGTK